MLLISVYLEVRYFMLSRVGSKAYFDRRCEPFSSGVFGAISSG